MSQQIAIFAHESLSKAFGTCNLKSSGTLSKVLTYFVIHGRCLKTTFYTIESSNTHPNSQIMFIFQITKGL